AMRLCNQYVPDIQRTSASRRRGGVAACGIFQTFRGQGRANQVPVKGRPSLLANGFASRQNKSQKEQCDCVPSFHATLPLTPPAAPADHRRGGSDTGLRALETQKKKIVGWAGLYFLIIHPQKPPHPPLDTTGRACHEAPVSWLSN